MRKFGFATLIGTAATAASLGLAAPVIAAPTGAGNAQDTIASLQAQGYKVVVSRLSETPLDQASVVSIGEGPTFSKTDQNNKAGDDYTGYDRQFAPDNVKTVHVYVR